MFQFLLIPAAFLLASLILKKENIQGIKPENIYKNYLIKLHKKDNISAQKRKTTIAINKVVSQKIKGFKIGKTAVAENRANQHKEYKHMFLLCESHNPNLIEEMESYYNKKYINYKKNDNKKTGSAGKMSDVNGKYYLYIITR